MRRRADPGRCRSLCAFAGLHLARLSDPWEHRAFAGLQLARWLSNARQRRAAYSTDDRSAAQPHSAFGASASIPGHSLAWLIEFSTQLSVLSAKHSKLQKSRARSKRFVAARPLTSCAAPFNLPRVHNNPELRACENGLRTRPARVQHCRSMSSWVTENATELEYLCCMCPALSLNVVLSKGKCH